MIVGLEGAKIRRVGSSATAKIDNDTALVKNDARIAVAVEDLLVRVEHGGLRLVGWYW